MGACVGADWSPVFCKQHVYPTQVAPILRRSTQHAAHSERAAQMEVLPAHFGLLTAMASDLSYGAKNVNASSEKVANEPRFNRQWIKGQRCIIPVKAIYEPDWRTGEYVPCRITRVDGETMGVAGLWQRWTCPDKEPLNSFTMLTVNADDHHIFKHLHRSNPKRSADKQNKRMVVILKSEDYDGWLDAKLENAMDYMRQYPSEDLLAVSEPKELLQAHSLNLPN